MSETLNRTQVRQQTKSHLNVFILTRVTPGQMRWKPKPPFTRPSSQGVLDQAVQTPQRHMTTECVTSTGCRGTGLNCVTRQVDTAGGCGGWAEPR